MKNIFEKSVVKEHLKNGKILILDTPHFVFLAER